MIILYIFIFLLFILLTLSLYILRNLLFNKLKTDESLINYNIRTFSKQWYDKINSWYKQSKREYFKIPSKLGYELDCYEIKNNLNKYVIVLHGVTTNKEFVKKFSYLYDQLGFSIIAVDSRHHGLSGGKNITYGFYEKYDVLNVVNYIKEKRGNDIIIGIHGESMGAAILLSYASMVEDGCSFYVADCPYSNLYGQILSTIKKTIKLPNFINNLIIKTTFLISKIIYKVDLNSIDIKKNIKNIKNPILFLTAKNDDYIPTWMTKELYEESIGDNKEIHMFNDGFHAGSFNYQPEEYIETVKEFIKKYIEK